jgi:hypothetical protein
MPGIRARICRRRQKTGNRSQKKTDLPWSTVVSGWWLEEEGSETDSTPRHRDTENIFLKN